MYHLAYLHWQCIGTRKVSQADQVGTQVLAKFHELKLGRYIGSTQVLGKFHKLKIGRYIGSTQVLAKFHKLKLGRYIGTSKVSRVEIRQVHSTQALAKFHELKLGRCTGRTQVVPSFTSRYQVGIDDFFKLVILCLKHLS